MESRGDSTPEDSAAPRQSLRRFATFVAVVAVATFVFTSVAFLTFGPAGEAPLTISDLRVEPPVPVPDQRLTVRASVSGGSGGSPPVAWLFHASSYRNEISEVDRMTSEGGGTYSVEVGPFANGAEVWLLVAASTWAQGPVVSEHVIVPVGAVYVNATRLVIESVFHSPTSPGPQTPVTVFARIRGTDFVTQVFLSYGWFSRQARGAGNWFMGTFDGISYTAPIQPLNFGGSVPVGARFFYRVTAIDASLVTAASEIQTFVIFAR